MSKANTNPVDVYIPNPANVYILELEAQNLELRRLLRDTTKEADDWGHRARRDAARIAELEERLDEAEALVRGRRSRQVGRGDL